MSKQKTLIFFGAHPDDETFGMGSTLAQYAASGVRVYYACATRGESGTVSPEYMNSYSTIGDMRWDELKCAAQVLGLADLIYLGYHDSGMRGSTDNKHPQALAMAPVEEVAARIVEIIRRLRPDVVVTHDPGGGYGHPDHIAVHRATVTAFHAAGDRTKYPQSGPVFQPYKLYFKVHPHRFFKMLVKLMPLFRQDPHHFGRNKDIDLTKMADVEYPIHAVIHLTRRAIKTRNMAVACHASQGGGRPLPFLFRILRIVEKLQGQRDHFMRAHPPPTSQHREKDLFEGLS